MPDHSIPDDSDHANADGQKPGISWSLNRREFITHATVVGASCLLPTTSLLARPDKTESAPATVEPAEVKLNFQLNGQPRELTVDPRVTLLDALREKLTLFGTKKGCDHGQCGACTVLLNGRRVNSCLLLAAMCQNAKITTIEGLAKNEELHPMQSAFIRHDAFQCGYCTPGQICSAVGLVHEGHAHSDEEIRELMSGNICRCGAYQNILAAIKDVQSSGTTKANHESI
jgi:xanthine dehydrogenase YagT iron-sulfur-binding subunit